MRFLRAAGPLTAVVLGTAFVKIYHPDSISLVRIALKGLNLGAEFESQAVAGMIVSVNFIVLNVMLLTLHL